MTSNASGNAIQRRHAFDPKGRIVALEYPLPGDSIPKNARKRIDPWLAACVGCGADEVRSHVKLRLANLKAVGMGSVANYFRRCVPCSVLIKKDAAWLILRDQLHGFERDWYLPPPTPAESVIEALRRFQIGKNDSLEAFLQMFAGFREELPDVSGYFPSVQNWLTFQRFAEEMGWGPQKTPRVWAEGAVFYKSLNGDVLVLDRTARLAWWDHDGGTFKILFKRFENLPAHWLKYLRKNYPFSSWAP